MNLPNGWKDTGEVDLRVVARESLTVPAGTFDCFKVEGRGWVLTIGQTLEYLYWVAPGQINRFIAIETWWCKRGLIQRSDRQELESYTRAG